jgi:hypothetical protein
MCCQPFHVLAENHLRSVIVADPGKVANQSRYRVA